MSWRSGAILGQVSGFKTVFHSIVFALFCFFTSLVPVKSAAEVFKNKCDVVFSPAPATKSENISSEDALVARGSVFQSEGRFKKASQDFEAAAALNPKNKTAEMLAAWTAALVPGVDNQTAFSALDRLIDIKFNGLNDPRLESAIWQIQINIGKISNVIGATKAAIRLDPNNGPAYQALIRALRVSKKYNEALQQIELAKSRLAKVEEIFLEEGRLYLEWKKYDSLTALLREIPSSWLEKDAWLLLFFQHAMLAPVDSNKANGGSRAVLAVEVGDLIAARPKLHGYRFWYSYMLANLRTQKFSKVISIFEKIRADKDIYFTPIYFARAQIAAAQAYMELHQYENALSLLEPANKVVKKFFALRLQSDALRNLGRTSEANTVAIRAEMMRIEHEQIEEEQAELE